jgi:MFS family permease
LAKPFFYFANSWGMVAGVRWADRVGKGIRTAPRDALIADSAGESHRGLAFGFQRAADTAGAMLGLVIALGAVWLAQSNAVELGAATFRTVVLISIVPAVLAVLTLVLGAQDVPISNGHAVPKFALRSLGKPFIIFMVIVSIFDIGNSSDAFLILRAQERGLSVIGILAMLIVFNLIYALVSTPAGSLSDRVGRRRMILFGWLAYALIYFGFGLAKTGWQVWLLYVIYGLYYGLAFGSTKAMIADLVPEALRGTAYGTYNAVMGILDLPASVIAGVLWQGMGGWSGFGASAPFVFGGSMALIATLLMILWMPRATASSKTG